LAQAQLLLERRIAGVGGSGITPFSVRSVAELWKAAQADPIRFISYCDETATRVATGQLDIDKQTSATAAAADADKNDDEDDEEHGKGNGKSSSKKKGGKAGKHSEASTKKSVKTSVKKGANVVHEAAPEPALAAKDEKRVRRTEFDSLISDLVEKKK
jgi:hypothetical protein